MLECNRCAKSLPFNPRSQAPLGNAPLRSSASHPRATTSSYIRRPHRKQSFPDVRSQAELGNEEPTILAIAIGFAAKDHFVVKLSIRTSSRDTPKCSTSQG